MQTHALELHKVCPSLVNSLSLSPSLSHSLTLSHSFFIFLLLWHSLFLPYMILSLCMILVVLFISPCSCVIKCFDLISQYFAPFPSISLLLYFSPTVTPSPVTRWFSSIYMHRSSNLSVSIYNSLSFSNILFAEPLFIHLFSPSLNFREGDGYAEAFFSRYLVEDR